MKDKVYTKTCKLRSCKKEFKTNRKWQDYCEPDHQGEYWKERRKMERALMKIIGDAGLEKVIEKFGL